MNKESPDNRIRSLRIRSKTPLIVIVLVALIIRLAWVFAAPHIDPVLVQNPFHGDASGYHLLALNLLEGKGLSWDGETRTSYRMPGYPVFLAGIYVLTNGNSQAVRIVQAILGALLCIPVYRIADRLGGDAGAILSGIGVAVHPLLVYMTGWLYSETLFLLLLWTGIWWVAQTMDMGKQKNALFAGAILGLATMIRPEIVVFPLFTLLLVRLFLQTVQAISLLLMVQIVLFSVVLPWTVRNALVHQTFVPLTTNTGSNLYGGNNDMANGGYESDVGYVLSGLSEVASNRELTKRAFEWIKAHPWQFLRLLPQKMYKFLSPMEMGASESPLQKWARPVNIVYTGFLLLALWGAVTARKHWIGVLLIALFVYYALLTLIFFGSARFSLPTVPGLVILAVIGIVSLGRREKSMKCLP